MRGARIRMMSIHRNKIMAQIIARNWNRLFKLNLKLSLDIYNYINP